MAQRCRRMADVPTDRADSMTGACEGYACPPEHSVPSSTVIVHRPAVEQVPGTGIPDPTGLVAVALALTIAGVALIQRARQRRKTP